MSRQNIFTTGPFLSASQAIEDAGLNFYFSYLLQEAVTQQLHIEAQLEKAIDQQDEEKIKQLEFDLSILENAYQLSSFSESENTQ
jgi:hypothetical protein